MNILEDIENSSLLYVTFYMNGGLADLIEYAKNSDYATLIARIYDNDIRIVCYSTKCIDLLGNEFQRNYLKCFSKEALSIIHKVC